MGRRVLLACPLLCALCLAAPDATVLAWEIKNWWLDSQEIVIDEVLEPSGTYSSPAQFQMSEWNEIDSTDNSHPFQIAEEPEYSFTALDGDSTMGFLDGEGLENVYGLTYDPAVAWAATFYGADGRIKEADIMFDPAEDWDLGPAGEGSWFQRVAIHELGHARGLGHGAGFLSVMLTNTSHTLVGETLYMDDREAIRQHATFVPERDVVLYPKWFDGTDPRWMSFTPGSAREGETVLLQNLTIENRGSVAFTGPVEFAVFLSQDLQIEATDELLNTGSLGSLPTHTFSTFDWTVPVPPVLDCGTAYLGGIVDPFDDWSERYEANNSTWFTNGSPYNGGELAPQPLEILLAQDHLEPNPSTDSAAIVALPFGDNLSLDSDHDEDYLGLDITEYGELEVEVNFSHSLGNIELQLLDFGGGVVGSSQTTQSKESLRVHVDPGTYFVRVFGKGEGSCNRYEIGIQLHPGAIDLVPSPAFDPPSEVVPGESVQIMTSVINEGHAPSGSFDLGIYAATDAACGPADLLLGSRTVSSLEYGEWNHASLTVTIPTSLPLGENFLCLVADPQGAVGEEDETNNRAVVPVVLADPIFDDTFESGDTTKWSATVPP